MNRPFQFTGRIRSFKYAFEGLQEMLKTQHNAWIHLTATFIIIIAGFLLNLSVGEWCLIVLAMIAVWISEALNTAFEYLADVASPEFHPLVKKSKDVAAGAVLIAAVGSVIIGLLIFTPKLHSIFW